MYFEYSYIYYPFTVTDWIWRKQLPVIVKGETKTLKLRLKMVIAKIMLTIIKEMGIVHKLGNFNR